MQNRAAGFEIKAFALVASAQLIVSSFGTDINKPDSGLTSWEPLPFLSWLEFPVEKFCAVNVAETTRQIKNVARFFGADLVGIAKLDMRWVYSNHYIIEAGESKPVEIDEGYKFVIIMALEMDARMIGTAPSALQMAEVLSKYSRMTALVSSLAQFIRRLGYRAIPALNDTALNVPIAVDAGLGQMGRHGLLISPLFGPRQRLCKVITDLPLQQDEPIEFGVTEFCSTCKKCARECPSHAISDGERTTETISISNNPGVLKWSLSAEKCCEYWSKVGTNCGICVRVCPFNKSKGKLHNAVRWFIKHMPQIDPAILWMDDRLKYGRYIAPKVFWNADMY